MGRDNDPWDRPCPPLTLPFSSNEPVIYSLRPQGSPALPLGLASHKSTSPWGHSDGVAQGLWDPSLVPPGYISAAEYGQAFKGDDPHGLCSWGGAGRLQGWRL